MNALSRRFLCSVAPAAVLLLATVLSKPIAHSDAELAAIGQEALPMIEEYERFTAAWFALPAGHPDSGWMADLADPASHRLEVLWKQALPMQATTAEGLRVRAVLLQHELRSTQFLGGPVVFQNPAEEMAWSLARDMLAIGETA